MALYIRRDEWVKTVLGPAVPGAQVYVVNQPANTTSLPPSPLATIYGDSGGVTQLTQPLITDGFGHTYFYVAPGVYTIVVADNGALQQVYPDQTIGTGISLETNGTPNTVQTIENLVAGANITLTPDGFGATVVDAAGSSLVLQTNGTLNSDQSLLNLQQSVTITITDNGSGNIEFSANVPSILSGALGILATSYVWQALPYQNNANSNGGSLVGTMDTTASGGPFGATEVLPSSQNVVVANGVNQGHGFEETLFLSPLIGNVTVGLLKSWLCQIAFQSDDTSRHWIGLCNVRSTISASGSLCANDFVGRNAFNSGDFIGFRFSPATGDGGPDVHWQAYVGGVALNASTLVDTGIAPTFNGVPHILQVNCDGTNFTFYVDGVLGATIPVPSLYLTAFGGTNSYMTTNGGFISTIVSDTDYGDGGVVDWNLVAVAYTLAA